MAIKYRAQILLEPEQHRKLQQMAEREGRSISDVARQVIQAGLEAIDRDAESVWNQRMAAIEGLSIIREEAQRRYGTYPGDLIAEARSEREQQLEEGKNWGHKP